MKMRDSLSSAKASQHQITSPSTSGGSAPSPTQPASTRAPASHPGPSASRSSSASSERPGGSSPTPTPSGSKPASTPAYSPPQQQSLSSKTTQSTPPPPSSSASFFCFGHHGNDTLVSQVSASWWYASTIPFEPGRSRDSCGTNQFCFHEGSPHTYFPGRHRCPRELDNFQCFFEVYSHVCLFLLSAMFSVRVLCILLDARVAL